MPRHRRPRLRLSPFQREILWILEEARGENFLDLLIELRTRLESTDERFVSEVLDALQGLVRLDYVSVWKHEGLVPIRIERLSELEPNFGLDLERGIRVFLVDQSTLSWTWNEPNPKQPIEVVLENTGLEALTR
jgi:hypothetical protein